MVDSHQVFCWRNGGQTSNMKKRISKSIKICRWVENQCNRIIKGFQIFPWSFLGIFSFVYCIFYLWGKKKKKKKKKKTFCSGCRNLVQLMVPWEIVDFLISMIDVTTNKYFVSQNNGWNIKGAINQCRSSPQGFSLKLSRDKPNLWSNHNKCTHIFIVSFP